MSALAGSAAWHPRSARHVPAVSLALFLVAVLLFWSPRLTSLLQYDRAATPAGEDWRVLTCQWTHWNLSHLIWDALTFLVLGVVCESVCRVRFLACVTASAVLIPCASAAAMPQMHYYRGLSGLDSALFVLLAVQLIRVNGPRDRVVAVAAVTGLVGFALKTVFECITGRIIFVQPESAFTPVPLAHIVGGAIGLVIASLGESRGAAGRRGAARAVRATVGESRDRIGESERQTKVPRRNAGQVPARCVERTGSAGRQARRSGCRVGRASTLAT